MPITNRVTRRKPDKARACDRIMGPEERVEPDGMHDHGEQHQATSDENFYEH